MSDHSRVEEIFLAALECRNPHDCVDYLNEVCRGDLELKAQVERLLLAHPQAERLLEPGRAPAVKTADFNPPADGPETIIGGRYKLLEPIGEGGMGTVFMAQQIEPVKRLVALKVIKPGMDSKQILARFEAERQALALMDHPNIAKVLDGGMTEGSRPFFVMELVRGLPITRFCDERRLTPRERLQLFTPVCQAIGHAHQKGVIHRDIKPNNVLIAQYDGRPVPKVIDFGIAKATGQALTEKTLVTGFGAVVGTVEYMSPEQAELNQLDIDTRSDVYSLGVLLYELLTGTTPIEQQRLGHAAILEMLRVVREEEPQRPSTRLSTSQSLPSIAANRGIEPKTLTGMLRNELDWIVMKALEKDRNRRYASPTAFVDDIERYLRQDVVLARPPSSAYRLRKFIRRHRAGALLFLSFVVMFATLVSASFWQAVVARRAERIAIDLKNDAEAARADESAARKSAEARVFGTKFQTLAAHPTHMALGDARAADRREDVLRLAYLLRAVPDHAPAWRDHLVMTLILAGRSISPLADLPDRHGFDVEWAKPGANGRLIATATAEGSVQVRDYPSLASRFVINPFARVASLDVYREYPVYLGFLDHDRVVWTIANGKLRLWDSTSGRALSPHISSYHPRWSPDGSRVVIRNAGEIHGGLRQQALERQNGPATPSFVGWQPLRE